MFSLCLQHRFPPLRNTKPSILPAVVFGVLNGCFQSITGVLDTECGYANGKPEITPTYSRVCQGDTGYRETVRVTYDPQQVTLFQLLTAFFYVIDPTVTQQQGPDIGDQYQTGIYFVNPEDGAFVHSFAEQKKVKYPVFAVEIAPLSNFVPAEEYHQDYLIKNPDGYCHISPHIFDEINAVLAAVLSLKV